MGRSIKGKNMKCVEALVLGDDFGDNDCTFYCQKDDGHEGLHEETGKVEGAEYKIEWSTQG